MESTLKLRSWIRNPFHRPVPRHDSQGYAKYTPARQTPDPIKPTGASLSLTR